MEDKISEEMAEVLEALWTLEEKEQPARENLLAEVATKVTEDLLAKLQRDGLIEAGGRGRFRLLPAGKRLAEQIIRRHRLAERLICDVLGSEVEESEAAACEFEHLLADGITNSICTLLGHPRFCPHNRPIPEGDCCRQARGDVKPIVIPCDQMNVGETGRIAYFSTPEHGRMLKLSALGIIPGVRLKLLQKWPSFVVQCDETEIAIEEQVARNIYLRPEQAE